MSVLVPYLPVLVTAAGIGQLILITASLAIPRVLRWHEDTAKLRPLTRQVFWTYAIYIWSTNLSFGLVSLRPDWLLDRSPLATCVTGFITAYWVGRVLIQFFYFDRSDAPQGTHVLLAEVALVGLFVFLSLVYAAALLLNLGVIGSVNGYTPRDPMTLALVGVVLIATLLAGLVIGRLPPRWYARLAAWLVTIGATVGAEQLCRDEPAGVRMLAIIGALLYGMKGVITVEARADGMPMLSVWQWLGFAALWPGMRPAIFADAGRERQAGAWALVGAGCLRGGIGLALVALAWLVWHHGRPSLSDDAACVLATVLLLPGLSLVIHFGIFNVVAGLWRLIGVDARPLFRAPLAARSLGDFWGRRWNLAFSEMTALGVYRPLAASLGRRGATVVAFLASGLLHELAISVPVMAGFGLPLAYFLLHGALVLVERGLERAGRPVSGWGWWARVWVLGWLAVPMPILFHQPFLRGVVWPLIGLE